MASARSSVRSNGLRLAPLLDHAGDAPGMPLFAEQAEDARKVAGLEAVDDVGRAWAGLRHAHIERPVGAEGEAALGLVDLHGRDADVEHDAIGFGDGFVEMRERAVHERQPSGGFPFERASRFDGIGVTVDRHYRRACREQRPRVAACPERAVDDGLSLGRLKCGDHLAKENRNVAGRSANRGVPSAVASHHSGCSPGFVPCRSCESLALTSAP